MIKSNLSHIHFREETRLPYPGERVIACSSGAEPEVVRYLDETIRFEPHDYITLGCRIRQPENRQA